MSTATAPNTMQLEKVGKSKRLLLVAILLGLLAAVMNFMSSARVQNVVVLKAKKQILAGTPVTESMFDRVVISGNLKEMRSLVVDANDFPKAFRNRSVAEKLEAGQLLMLRSFDISGDDVRESISQGQRAISIDVPDEAQAVAYFVRPGDGVDLWGWINGQAQLLKEGACVRAVCEAYAGPDSAEGGKERYRTVTLVVAEPDVRSLVSNLALAEDKIRLSLVGPCDPKNEKPAMRPIEPPSVKGAAGGAALRSVLPDDLSVPEPEEKPAGPRKMQ